MVMSREVELELSPDPGYQLMQDDGTLNRVCLQLDSNSNPTSIRQRCRINCISHCILVCLACLSETEAAKSSEGDD